jgi:hypothetical protein
MNKKGLTSFLEDSDATISHLLVLLVSQLLQFILSEFLELSK